jgi:hypothetical protein
LPKAGEVLMERSVSTGTRVKAAPLSKSAGVSHRAITERILRRADQAGSQAAVIDAVDGTVTAWPRLAWTIRAAAHGLSRRGLADGDTAAVFVQDAARFALAVNSIRAAGATALAIRPDASMADIVDQLNARGVRLLITAAPLAEFAVEAADRSQVRQVFSFGESAGTTPFRSLLAGAKPGADTNGDSTHGTGASGALDGADSPGPGLSYRDVVVTGPPCGDGQTYTSLVDLALLAGATVVAAPIALLTAAVRVYKGTAAIVPYGTAVSGVPPDRVLTVVLPAPPREPTARECDLQPRTADRRKDELPMQAEPGTAEPKHTLSALTTFELARYRRELEHAIKTLPETVEVRELLQQRLAEVVAEVDDRARSARANR